ncbi:MAG: DUF2905 domain-containing protein [Endomicrobia bacterium]|nr:DUF2905 domain-containing protein [Endomicrobiia bacterium]
MRYIEDYSKFIIIVGVILIVVGIVFKIFDKLPFLGRLPGDIYIKRKNFVFYFPLITSIIISVVITLLLNIFFRRK